MSDAARFFAEVQRNVEGLKADPDLAALSRVWVREVSRHKYSYNFTWLGRPVIQVPQDMMAMQEILWKVRPELVIETGVAHGGSAVFYASMLELAGRRGRVLGVDIDIREHARAALDDHPMRSRIDLLQGSSIDPLVIDEVRRRAEGKAPIVVVLDSNHTHDHVLAELRAYAPLVKKGSYLVVFDTLIEDLPDDFFAGRPWKKGNSPKSAVREFLRETDRFVVDDDIDAKLLISVAPGGYLRCVAD
jgi:cephalosporin hydroxylase